MRSDSRRHTAEALSRAWVSAQEEVVRVHLAATGGVIGNARACTRNIVDGDGMERITFWIAVDESPEPTGPRAEMWFDHEAMTVQVRVYPTADASASSPPLQSKG